MTVTFPLATITLMMWIIWSDSVRKRRSAHFLYGFRVVVYLIAVAAIGWLTWRDRFWAPRIVVVLSVAAMIVGLGGAAYFWRKARASE